TGRDADAEARHYIPDSPKVLIGSKLLQPGQEQAIAFDVPSEPGIYPYVCTYPGHWRRMYGALYVVPDFQSYQAKPEAYLASLNLPVKDALLAENSRGQEWSYMELRTEFRELSGRSHEVGKAAFQAANCTACHRMDGQGQNFGPDLARLPDEKRKASYLLGAILEPSRSIAPEYATTSFLMFDGTTKTGMIMEENDDVVKIIVDPLAKDKLTILNKDDIDDRRTSKVSPMPAGMVNKLSREEIKDLIAYLISGGDMKHKVFDGGHAHHSHSPMP
ncbi:MAG: c-type cytochrome, partial [Planctomycetota bacterium]